MDLPGPLRSSSSHTSLSSTEVYREFESAEPIHMTFGKESSPLDSVDTPSAADTIDSATLVPPHISISSTVLTDDMTTALVGELFTLG